MAVLSTGQSFSSGDQVTAQKLDDIIGQAFFTSAADTTDNSTLTLGSSKLKVADAGITSTQLATDSVITAKIQDGAVTSAKLDAGAVSVLMPSGSLMPYAGSSAPTGFLICDGSAKNTTTEASLFAILQYNYGGSGTSFNIPDLRGRVIAGLDSNSGGFADRLTTSSAANLNGRALAATGGDEEEALTIAKMPAHTHGISTASGNNNQTGVAGNAPKGTDLGSPTIGTYSGGAISTGGGNAHNNVQPTIILNYIIKT